MVNATIFKPFLRNVLRLKRCKDGIIIIPREIYLTIIDLVRCYLISVKNFYCSFGIKGKIQLDKIDVTKILYFEIKRECASKHYFLNLLEYFCTKSILNKIKIKHIIYPFEHRSWESMLIYAVKEKNMNIKITGYQHTSIAPKHTNMILGKGESKHIILPDKIICMGKITKNILKEMGNIPADILEIGCAMRQKMPKREKLLKGRKNQIKNILAVSTDPDDYMKMLEFLSHPFYENVPLKIKLRPHPLVFIKKTPCKISKLSNNIEIDQNSDLETSLDWADVVLYSSSTVSLEALQRGIPVIYLDSGDCLCPDPLFESDNLKWKISSPDGIEKVIEIIQNTTQNTFQQAKMKAMEYASKYIYYPNKERMEVFIKDI